MKGDIRLGDNNSSGVFYKYIHFVLIGSKTKTKIWECRNNRSKEALGTVKWYAPWRQYCFMPTDYALVVFNSGCLDDIKDFLDHVNTAHKSGK
jgi:hypothetical protein